MKQDILQRISCKLPTLPKNQQRVAYYLFENWEAALYESSIMIAKKIDVSQSTVVRTVSNLGYSGFPEFQAELRQFLQHQLSSTKRIKQVETIQEGQSTEQRIAQVSLKLQQGLKNDLSSIDPEKIKLTSDLIWNKERVFVLGLRASSVLAHYFGEPLSMIRENVRVLSSDHTLIENLRTVTQNDVLVLFCFTRYSRYAVEAAMFARERKCLIVGITDTPESPIAGIADIIYYIPVNSMHFSNSYVTVFALIDVLLNIVGSIDHVATMKALESMEEGFEKFKVYYTK